MYGHLDYFQKKKEEQLMGKYDRGQWNVEFIANIYWFLKKGYSTDSNELLFFSL